MKTFIVYDLDSQMSDDGASFGSWANVSQDARKPRCISDAASMAAASDCIAGGSRVDRMA